MRIWDKIDAKRLCRQHLLGEHRELHAIWSIIANRKDGYKNHPEVKRWHGHLRALTARHSMLVAEMRNRRMRHASPLPSTGYSVVVMEMAFVTGPAQFPAPWDDQETKLAAKTCNCQPKSI